VLAKYQRNEQVYEFWIWLLVGEEGI
jgi:hypothetical protein